MRLIQMYILSGLVMACFCPNAFHLDLSVQFSGSAAFFSGSSQGWMKMGPPLTAMGSGAVRVWTSLRTRP